MKITENFRLHEFTATATGLENTPSFQAICNLVLLCQMVLQPLRSLMEKPMLITSGYRSADVNKAVGGSPTSQHLTGRAADFTFGSPELNREAFELAETAGLPFDQMIDERGYRWIHISYDLERHRRQILHRK